MAVRAKAEIGPGAEGSPPLQEIGRVAHVIWEFETADPASFLARLAVFLGEESSLMSREAHLASSRSAFL